MSRVDLFLIPRPRQNAKLRLFCFPYAGGSPHVFRDWPEFLPKEVEVCAAQLPGREMGRRDTLHTEAAPVVDMLTEALAPRLDVPFAFFGHSLGALLAFLCARQLRRRYNLLPLQLFASGRSAPHWTRREKPFYDLPQDVFIQRLKGLGGTETTILEDAELMGLLTPILRADFQMNETYEYTPEPALDCPISAFRGARDELMSYDEVAAWREHTTGTFRLRTLPDGHFFITTARDLFLQILSYDLTQILASLQDPATADAAVAAGPSAGVS